MLTDPTVRSLLEALATTGDLSILPPLADRLEELGDERAGQVRGLKIGAYLIPDGGGWFIGRRGHTWGPPHAAAEDAEAALVSHVLALFPEGPRWAVEVNETLLGFPVLVSPGKYLTPAAAREAAGPFPRAAVTGPHYPAE